MSRQENDKTRERPSHKVVIPGAGVKVLRAAGCVCIAAYFIIVGVYAHREMAETRCNAIRTDVNTGGQDVLITDKGLRSIIKSEFPDLKGTLLSEINYAKLESQIERLEVVKRCEAYPTIGGAVHIDIYQRIPIMRVFSSGGGSYYMDEEGYKITALPGMRTHTLIVNGAVNSMLDHSDLIALCSYISRDSFWRAMIEQVYVTRKHEYVLIPRVGNHTVEFGTAANLEEKFGKLRRLYKNGWEKHEWNVYSKVNLRYEGQKVCTKRHK